MIYQRDVEIPVRDGAVLRANLYRPVDGTPAPVVMTFGPYGKDLHMSELHNSAYVKLEEQGALLNWETPNPEWWVPAGYAVLRVDQRGSGTSPGVFDPFSETQSQDYYDAIEWAAVQPWSTGKVGLVGVSYYAMSQWQVAALNPPHLMAMIPWEGAADVYRDFCRHGGILNNGFIESWWPVFALKTQHGAEKAGGHLSPEELAANRVDLLESARSHPLYDEHYRRSLPDPSTIQVPFLSVGNWGAFTLHLRGNVEAFVRAQSKHKWLRIHTGNHFEPYHTEASRLLQKRFLDYWLKGEDTGVLADAPVQLAIRHGDGEVIWRDEQAWPLPGTEWTKLHLDAANGSLGAEAPDSGAQATYEAPAGGVSFSTAPFDEATEITGPLALRLWVSSTAADMDVFATVRNVDADGKDVWGVGSGGEPVAIAKGWLRVSHRALDAALSLPYRPYHPHDRADPVPPGEVVPVEVEVLPTSMVFEAGHRLVLDVEAHDGVGSGRGQHNDPTDRPAERFAGENTLYTGPEHESYLLVAVVPARRA
ncbi:MAG: CocE/NonD family hydrolase [Chloroflexi bacterium]|nr:CocE/NonD family hydrolase [Chloroflexota bacterium]